MWAFMVAQKVLDEETGKTVPPPEELEGPRKGIEKRPPERATGDVGPLVAAVPPTPMVDAYIAMAVEAYDRYRDLDAAHDWLDRALELDPNNAVAQGLFDQVKAAEQQAGLQRAGIALGALQEMLIRKAKQQELKKHKKHYGKEHYPAVEQHRGSPPHKR
ncbi:hypothetical protein MYX64_10930 [Nitrospinae bacterium AH_259_B05_G02_I21]|nr:hypothetical protein [Nitrospinae bacterium AH_259_B05_G02_I21]